MKLRYWIILVLVALGAMALVFSLNGFFDTRIDAPIYAAQITSFAQGNPFSADSTVLLRLFKPFYAIIGGTIFHTAHPLGMILGLNIIFYLALIVTSFYLFKELEYSDNESVIGAAWIATAYPVLKYGLALGTDVSGWLLSALTILLGLIALRKNSNFWLSVASIVGFLGATAKETGVLGLVALCLLVAWRFRKSGIKTWVIKVLAVGLPALILYVILILTIAGHAPTFLDWLSTNNTEYSGSHGSWLLKLIGVEGSTFGLYWLGVIYAVVFMIRSKSTVRNLDLIVTALISTIVILFWPLFISRIAFIQFIWVMPLALFAYSKIRDKFSVSSSTKRKTITSLLVAIPILLNVVLFLLSSGGSLFDLLR